MTLQEKDIQNILASVVTAFRKSDKDYAQTFVARKNSPLSKLFGEKKQSLPEYYDTYKFMVDYYERIRIHSELGYFPDKLFAERSPNQTDKEAKYIQANFKQVTLPFFIDYVSTVTRAFSDPNWKVIYGEDKPKYTEAGKSFQSYVENEIKNYGSIENFMRSIVPALKAQDANGIIAVRPLPADAIYDDDGQEIEDPARLDNPVPVYYCSKQVVAQMDGVFAMVELTEKSIVTHGNAPYKMGMIYELYDSENIWRITQTGRYSDFTFDIEIYYNHQWGKVPVTKLKGIPRIYDNEIVWMSPLLYVTDLLDLVLLNSSNLQISINNCVYPYRIMYGDICEFQDKDGDGGMITCNNGDLFNMANKVIGQCTRCNGTGLKSRISPQGVMLLRPPTGADEAEGKLSQKPMDYVSPDVTTLEFLKEKIAEDYSKAQDILHLRSNINQVNPGTGDPSNTSATQAANGQKALRAFVKTVSDQTFDIYQFLLDAIGWMRYGVDYDRSIVRASSDFDLSNEMDYIYLMGEVGKYNLPPFVLYSIIENYLNVLYQDDKDAGDAFKLIVQTDRLLTLSNADIQVKLGLKTVEKWEEILHTSAAVFVQQLSSEFTPIGSVDSENYIARFFDQELTIQQEALVKKAQDVAVKIDAAAGSQQQALIKSISEGRPQLAA